MSLSRTDGLTASEQLQQRAEQKQMETENTLLKAALAQSSERCEESLRASEDLLRTAEQNWQQRQKQSVELHGKQINELNRNVSENLNRINESVSKLKNVNQELSITISDQVFDLVDSVRSATVAEVQAALTANKQELGTATVELHRTLQATGQKMESTVSQIEKRLDSKLSELETKQRRFFAMDGFKHYVFWSLPVIQLAEIALLVWLLFFKG